MQAALNAHVRANRPIGGSSAGLAILGHYSYTSLDGGSMESKIALADPFNSGVTLESDFLHYRWLEDVITDTHFSKRSRLGRLIVYVARLNNDHGGSKIYGIGLDEKTALIIDAEGVGRIAEGSAGSAWIVMPQVAPTILMPGRPLTIKDVRIVRLDETGTIDLKTRSVIRPTAETHDAIDAGVPTQDSLTSAIMMRNAAPSDEG